MKTHYLQLKNLFLLYSLFLCCSIYSCQCNNPLLLEEQKETTPPENNNPTPENNDPGVIINIVPCCDQDLVGNSVLIAFKLTHDPGCVVDKDKLQVKITATAEPTGIANAIRIFEYWDGPGNSAEISNDQLSSTNTVLNTKITITIAGAPGVTQGDITLQLMYNGKPLEHAEGRLVIHWETINNITKQLHHAIKNNNLQKVQPIINDHIMEIQPKAVDSYGETLLWGTTKTHSVFCYNDPDIIKELLQIPGIDVNAKSIHGSYSFLEKQLDSYRDNVEIVKLLIAKGATTQPGTTMLHAILNTINSSVSDASNAQIRKLTYIATSFPELINTKDKDGNTPLHIAAQRSYKKDALKAIQLLVSKGADITIPNNHHKTAKTLGEENLGCWGSTPLELQAALNGTYTESF